MEKLKDKKRNKSQNQLAFQKKIIKKEALY